MMLTGRKTRSSDTGGQGRQAAAWLSGLVLVIFAAAPAPAQDMCTACHANAGLITGLSGDSSRARQLLVDQEEYAASIHGSLGFSCTLCHTGIQDYPHGSVSPVNCGGCHRSVQEQLAGSIHGLVHPLTGTPPATCKDCHGSHHIRVPTDPESSVYRLTQFTTCATCHSDAEKMAAFGQENVETVPSYLNSIHGHGLVDQGLTLAPVCTDCHGHAGTGAHEIEAVSSAESPMNRVNVVATCGRCHAGILAQYDRGIHGTMLRQGNPDVPTCIDCHTEHAIQPITSPASGVSPAHIAQTCGECHDRIELNEKYGLPPARERTFLGSFHGVALESGQTTVANCGSCHGAHEILPSSDPRSSIHPDNLAATCSSCHPGIGPHVTEGKIHVASLRQDVNLFAYAVQLFYYALIAGILVYGAVMIFLDQYRHRVVEPRLRRGGNG